MSDLGELISRKVAEQLDAAFVEKEVATRVEKLVVEAVGRALGGYSETAKLIEKAVEEALRVDRLDLPTYGHVVAQILKAQIEARVSELVAGRLSSEMDELLNLAPKEVRLSDIAKAMIEEGNHGVEYGEAITVIVERSDVSRGYSHIYLDEESQIEPRDKYRCRHHLAVDENGTIYSATVANRELKTTTHIGHSYGIAQKIRAYVACGTKLILDEDNVVTSVGDY